MRAAQVAAATAKGQLAGGPTVTTTASAASS
jgi:hypothetical protein